MSPSAVSKRANCPHAEAVKDLPLLFDKVQNERLGERVILTGQRSIVVQVSLIKESTIE
jgi:hypothetical protein